LRRSQNPKAIAIERLISLAAGEVGEGTLIRLEDAAADLLLLKN
jgi:hypothetical protein